MPATIEVLELAQQKLEKEISTEQFYQQDKKAIANTLQALAELQAQLETAFERWTYLEEQAG